MNQNPQDQNFTTPVEPQAPVYTAPVVAPKKSGKAIAGLVLGICGLVFMFAQAFIGLICSILGIVFSALGRKECDATGKAGRSMATAGLVCSIVALGIVVVVLVIAIAAAGAVLGALGSLA
ncbi:MAG: DUF4190 domain-containing protein [Clostridia bacterium]|nr:DUF4190 domain-containing protein [Clostridia bacterium]